MSIIANQVHKTNDDKQNKTAKQTPIVLDDTQRDQVKNSFRKFRAEIKSTVQSNFPDYEYNDSDFFLAVKGKAPYKNEWQQSGYSYLGTQLEISQNGATGFGIKPNYKFVFLDCDDENSWGFLQELCTDPEDMETLQSTVSQTSGKDGRRTVMFLATDYAIQEFCKIHKSALHVFSMLEVFYGSNNQIVGCGSYHPDTLQPYYAINDISEYHFKPIPDDIVDGICEHCDEVDKKKPKETQKTTKQSKTTSKGKKKLSALHKLYTLDDAVGKIYNRIDHEFKSVSGRKELQGYCSNPNCNHNNDGGGTFTVNADPDSEKYLTWYCFGCNVGGNPIHYEKFSTQGNATTDDMKEYKHFTKQLFTRLGIDTNTSTKVKVNDEGQERDYYQPKTWETTERCVAEWLKSENYIIILDECYHYTGLGYWRLVERDELQAIVADFLDECYDLKKVESDDEDDDEVEYEKKYVYATNSHLNKCYDYALKKLNYRAQMPANRHLICFRNGTYNMKLGTLQNHSKDDYLLWRIPYDYDPDKNTPAKFLDFLHNAVGEEQVKIVQAWTRCLLDHHAPYGKFVHLLGDSGCGKGTLLRVWASLFDEGNVTAQSSFAILGDADKRHQYLTNTRFYYAPDASGFVKGLGAFYELVDNGSMSGRRLHSSNTYNIQWDCRFALASVRHLSIENSGDGWHRRCIPIRFNGKPAKPDYYLGSKLEEELGEIVAWAFSMPFEEMMDVLYVTEGETQTSLKNEQLVASDSVAGFINAMLLPADNAIALGYLSEEEANNRADNPTPDDLYEPYKAYCHYVGGKAKGRDHFTHSLKSLIGERFVPRSRKREGEKRISVQAHFRNIIVNEKAIKPDKFEGYVFLPEHAYDYGLEVFEGKECAQLVSVSGKAVEENPSSSKEMANDTLQQQEKPVQSDDNASVTDKTIPVEVGDVVTHLNWDETTITSTVERVEIKKVRVSTSCADKKQIQHIHLDNKIRISSDSDDLVKVTNQLGKVKWRQ